MTLNIIFSVVIWTSRNNRQYKIEFINHRVRSVASSTRGFTSTDQRSRLFPTRYHLQSNLANIKEERQAVHKEEGGYFPECNCMSSQQIHR